MTQGDQLFSKGPTVTQTVTQAILLPQKENCCHPDCHPKTPALSETGTQGDQLSTKDTQISSDFRDYSEYPCRGLESIDSFSDFQFLLFFIEPFVTPFQVR